MDENNNIHLLFTIKGMFMAALTVDFQKETDFESNNNSIEIAHF